MNAIQLIMNPTAAVTVKSVPIHAWQIAMRMAFKWPKSDNNWQVSFGLHSTLA